MGICSWLRWVLPMRIEQTTEEKAAHFASIGMMDRANYYATIVLINEIKELRKSIDERV